MPVFSGVSAHISDESARLKALKARHAAIEEQINLEKASPAVSDVFLKTLKKKKLFLKEKIEGIRSAAQ